MKVKYISSLAVISAVGLILNPAVFAQTVTSTPPVARTTLKQINQTNRMVNIKVRADNQIQYRLTSLNNALARIGNAKKLSAGDKSKFTSEVQTDIANMTDLKAKIDSDTDLTTLIADAKSIFTDYRVYAIFLPQVHMLAAVDIMGVTADNLASVSARLQTRIQRDQSQNQDITNLNNLLTDMNSKTVDSRTQAQAAESEVISLSPADFPASQTLKDARSKIKTGTQDLKTARQDGLQILQGLRSLEKEAANASTTAANR